MDSLLTQVLDAHGGAERWAAAGSLRARVRSGGLLLRTRVPRDLLADYLVHVTIGEPVVEIEPRGARAGVRCLFDRGAVRIEGPGGEPRGARQAPRTLFSGPSGIRRNLRWDELDSTYFAGYALWNYFNAPYLLARAGVESREIEPAMVDGESRRRLQVDFPVDLDTHSRQQVFWFDSALRLRRHDYVAEVIGGWASAAHMCDRHVEAGGLLFPTRRRVYPSPRGRPLPAPTLVSLDIFDIQVG